MLSTGQLDIHIQKNKVNCYVEPSTILIKMIQQSIYKSLSYNQIKLSDKRAKPLLLWIWQQNKNLKSEKKS